MARRRHGFVSRGGRQIRQTMWVETGATVTNLGGTSTAALVAQANAALLALRPYTITRTLGIFGVRSDQAVADESYDAAIGQCLVTEQAAAIGITALPTPFSDLGSDMFYMHQILMGRFEFIDGTGFQANSLTWVHYDSRAMRRCNDDQVDVITIESSSLGTGQTVHHAGRQLIKLH